MWVIVWVLFSSVEGAETSKFAVAGCDTARGAVELWRIRDGEHLPNWLTDSAIQVLSWLLAHSRDEGCPSQQPLTPPPSINVTSQSNG